MIANDVPYRVYPDGRVTDDKDNAVTTGGVDGLKAYLAELLRPKYSIYIINGVEYRLYKDGSATDSNGK